MDSSCTLRKSLYIPYKLPFPPPERYRMDPHESQWLSSSLFYHEPHPSFPARGGRSRLRPHLVGSAQVLELLLRPGVVGVPVGMELQRQFAIGLLDVLDGGAAGHPQDLVEISPAVGGEGG